MATSSISKKELDLLCFSNKDIPEENRTIEVAKAIFMALFPSEVPRELFPGIEDPKTFYWDSYKHTAPIKLISVFKAIYQKTCSIELRAVLFSQIAPFFLNAQTSKQVWEFIQNDKLPLDLRSAVIMHLTSKRQREGALLYSSVDILLSLKEEDSQVI